MFTVFTETTDLPTTGTLVLSFEQILHAAIKHTSVAYTIRGSVTSDLVIPNHYYRRIAQFACDFLGKHEQLPQVGDWNLWLSTLEEGARPGIVEALGRIQSTNIDNFTVEFLLECVIDELQALAASTARKRLLEMSSASLKDLEALTEQVRSIRPVALEGIVHLADVDRWVRPPTHEEYLSTGIPSLDRWIRGFGKELWFIMADSGVGKTIALINHGAAAVVEGATVVHVTLELSAENTVHRYYRRITESGRPEFHRNLEGVRAKAHHWLRYARGSAHIIRLPAYSTTPDDLDSILSRFTDIYGDFNLLILDYLDLLEPPTDARIRSEAQALDRMTHMVRNYCEKYDATVLSATQAVRGSNEGTRMRLSQMALGYGKVRGADGIIGLIQTEEELAVHQGRYTVLKAREAVQGVEVPLYINRDLMLIADLDHPTTQRIMTSLQQGWPPQRPGRTDSADA